MPESSIRKPKTKILIVEDDDDISSMLNQILSEEGHEVVVADDGAKASTLLGSITPDLVILDLQVPQKGGFELLKEIRKKDAEYGIFVPVIILTGVYTSREDKVTSLDSGADDFLPKPFDMVELLARVRSLLRVRDLYKRSQYLATHDHLTRCYNRRYLLDFLNRELLRYQRYKKPFSYLLIDLDHFKQINDQYGHEVGDQILVQIGYSLQDFFRAVDCVSRLGGDEFSVVLPDTALDDAKKVGKRLMEFISALKPVDPVTKEMTQRVGVSVGIATLPNHADNIEDLMRVADEAMYEAKKAGRNQAYVSGAALK